VLFKAHVAALETYNTALEQHLHDTLGMRFAERPGTDPVKRPIQEIVGVDRRLNQRWSTRHNSWASPTPGDPPPVSDTRPNTIACDAWSEAPV
jgi:hypothetical protein